MGGKYTDGNIKLGLLIGARCLNCKKEQVNILIGVLPQGLPVLGDESCQSCRAHYQYSLEIEVPKGYGFELFEGSLKQAGEIFSQFDRIKDFLKQAVRVKLKEK